MPKTFPIVLVTWTESERGWGCRPDGISIHLSLADQKAFAVEFNKQYNNLAVALVVYTRCDHNPTVIDAELELYQHLEDLKTKGQLGCFAYGEDEALIRRGKCPWGPNTYSVYLITGGTLLFRNFSLRSARIKCDDLYRLEVPALVKDAEGKVVYSPVEDKVKE